MVHAAPGQVPIMAKADSMTVDELQGFRRDVRESLAQVRGVCHVIQCPVGCAG